MRENYYLRRNGKLSIMPRLESPPIRVRLFQRNHPGASYPAKRPPREKTAPGDWQHVVTISSAMQCRLYVYDGINIFEPGALARPGVLDLIQLEAAEEQEQRRLLTHRRAQSKPFSQ